MRLIRRIPKRGFKNISRKEFLAVNISSLNVFEAGAIVTPEVFQSMGLANGVFDGIKILGVGTLSKKMTVKAHAFSAGAKAKIEAVGGTCEVI
jgi:large subunit ribosomal protein L15